jgi:hypothetical protein
MNENTLPNEAQRKALCELMHHAFVELRCLSGEQSQDLAYAFHNLPVEIYGWGSWNAEDARKRLKHYQNKYSKNPGVNYVELFNKIFPEI